MNSRRRTGLTRIASLLLFLPAPAATAGDFDVKAFIPESEGAFVVGKEYEIVLEVDLPGPILQGFPWQASNEPVSFNRPILQIDAPDCIELLGAAPEKLESPEDFQLSFERFPYGRRIREAKTHIAFRLVSEPSRKDRLGLNLITYLGPVGEDDRASSGFRRQRIMLRVKPGASAKGARTRRSDWGKSGTLAIGDRIEALSLSGNDGEPLDLAEILGKQNLLIISYRRET